MQITRKATAQWQGTGKDGKGTLNAAAGGLLQNTPYNFSGRFESGNGTNPEELIAAAHAGCFAMALSFGLNGAGFTAEELNVTAALTIEKQESGFTITKVHLVLVGKVPNMTSAQFIEAANAAKVGCPVSKVLNATITLDASLA
jgi:lipoyl-dependent peroxiredoxin